MKCLVQLVLVNVLFAEVWVSEFWFLHHCLSCDCTQQQQSQPMVDADAGVEDIYFSALVHLSGFKMCSSARTAKPNISSNNASLQGFMLWVICFSFFVLRMMGWYNTCTHTHKTQTLTHPHSHACAHAHTHTHS